MKTLQLLFLSILMLFTFVSFSQTLQKDSLPPGAIQVTPDQVQWVDGPSTLPSGTKICRLYGDVKKEGPFAIRVKLPASGTIKLHTHKNDEVVTVMEGSVSVGFGDEIHAALKKFAAGSFYVNPAGAEHFVKTGNEGAILQINSMGPWTIEFK